MLQIGRSLLIIAFVALHGSFADLLAQAVEPATSVQFEAASIRRSTADGRRSMALTPSGLSYVNVTVTDALVAAFGIERYQVLGPGWLTRDRYVIGATTGAPGDSSRTMRMLQSLLTERFAMMLHWEARELPVYVLRSAKDGPHGLKPVETRLGVIPAPGGMRFQGMTMTEFVDEFLSRLPSIDRAVIDGTSLNARYDFTLQVFDTDPPPGELKPSVVAGGPELFIHALEQVGLTLAREKRTVDVLIVDHAEKVPTEN
jgi:uncharacterized protein (TIGR03435 family)